MLIRILSLIAVFTMCASSVCAESGDLFNNEASGIFQATVNSFVALAGDNSLSAGTYKFRNNESPDVDISLYKIVGEIPLGDSSAQFVPLLELTPAYINSKQSLSTTFGDSDIDTDSWGIGGGVGLQIKFFDDLVEVTPRLKFQYSRIDFDLSNSDEDRDTVPIIDAYSYISSIEGQLRKDLCDNGSILSINTNLSFLYVDAASSQDKVDDFSDHSWIWRSRVSYEQPFTLSDYIGELFLRPGFARVDLYGAAKGGFGLRDFYEFSLDLITKSVATDYLSEVGIGATYLYKGDLQGWRVGFIFKIG